eukprot:scaffold32351_cov60-Attheya_sp.AAC.11
MAVCNNATVYRKRTMPASRTSIAALACFLIFLCVSQRIKLQFLSGGSDEESVHTNHGRRLADNAALGVGPIGRTLAKARKSENSDHPLRVLYVVTSLAEYDTGTRGTSHGADRLKDVVLPAILDAVTSMVKRGWRVDLFLILGYEKLERKSLIQDALPSGVGVEFWEDAMPLHYKKRVNQRGPDPGQKLEVATHGLSRQHRYVIKDKLMEYDFFACFEDDMRITADHVLNFLELSADIEILGEKAEAASDGMVHVDGESHRPANKRGKSTDSAAVGNDVVDDPISAEYLKRVIPGFIRVEVRDDRTGEHPIAKHINAPTYVVEVPIDKTVSRSIDPNGCCMEMEPGRGKMTPNPLVEDLVIWETNVGAAGVRKYPGPIGWAAAMPVQDIADVGSYWSGEGGIFGSKMTRPRRLDATLGQQAGWMATRSQVEYFDLEACPGHFLPPFDDKHWGGDSLKKHAVEFWSGGFQLFGQCSLNRILSLNPKRFSLQLLYHTSNNKQRTKQKSLFVRAGDFLGQLHTVKARAERSLTIE